jgi:hypothetical protein
MQRVEYYCSVCDFSTCHDLRTDQYYATVGDGKGLLGLVLEEETPPEYFEKKGSDPLLQGV